MMTEFSDADLQTIEALQEASGCTVKRTSDDLVLTPAFFTETGNQWAAMEGFGTEQMRTGTLRLPLTAPRFKHNDEVTCNDELWRVVDGPRGVHSRLYQLKKADDFVAGEVLPEVGQ